MGKLPQSGRGVGISATYTCNIGYQLVGASNRVCQPDGTWSGDNPACRGQKIPNNYYQELIDC